MQFSKTRFLAIILVVILALSYMLSGCSSSRKKNKDTGAAESSQPANSPGTDSSDSSEPNGSGGSDSGNNDTDSNDTDDGQGNTSGDATSGSQDGSSGDSTDNSQGSSGDSQSGSSSSSDNSEDVEPDNSVIIVIEEEEITEEEENLVDNDGAVPTDDQLDAEKLIKATWKQPNRVLVNWAPDEDWIPEDGYSLYRIIDDEVAMLAGDLGTEGFVAEMARDSVFIDFLIPTFDSSKITSDKFAALGITNKDQFKNLFTVDLNAADKIIPSADLFEDMQNGGIPASQGIAEKVPFEDTVGNFSISLITEINVPAVTLNGYQGTFSDTPAGLLQEPVVSQKEILVNEIMEAYICDYGTC